MAGDGWTRYKVDDLKSSTPNALATGPFGSAISSRHFIEDGTPVIRGSNLSQDVGKRLNDDGLVFVSERKAEEFSRSLAKPGDLVFTCWGTIGQVGLIDERSQFQKYVVSNKQMKLTPDPRKTSSLFLYYLFSSPLMRDQILNQGIGSSVPGFNLGQLRSITLNLPPLPEQRTIAHVLGTLDDKIELNRQMNLTLEEMARALFKSWFVDFDPVRARASLKHHHTTPTQGGSDWSVERARAYLDRMAPNIAALFPDRFVDSELGPIPAGWEVKALGESAKVVKGRSYRSVDLGDSNVALVTLKSVKRGGGYSPDGLKPYTGDYQPQQVVEAGEVIVAQTDVTQAAEVIGRTALVNDSPGFYTLVASLDLLVVRPVPPLTVPYLYGLLQSDAFHSHALARVNGTTVLHMQKDAIPEFRFPLPPEPVIASLTRGSGPLGSRLDNNVRDASALTALRDVLLPKLVSGKLRLPHVNRIPTRSA